MNISKLEKLNDIQDSIVKLKIFLRLLDNESHTPLNIKDELFKYIYFDDLIETATSRIKSHLDKLNTEFESL